MSRRATALPERLWRTAAAAGIVPGVPARVLLGNLEPVVALGMTAVLEERGVEVIGCEPRPQPLLLLAGQLRPDAVVLDLHGAESHDLAGRLRAAAPGAEIVLWARDEEVMDVGGRRIASPTADDLSAALGGRSIAAP